MRHFITTFIIIMAPLLTAMADNYSYFTFTNTDGSTASITSTNLEITFSDGKMIATNGTDNISLPISSLSTMAFAQTATDIQSANEGNDEEVDVYSTAGIHIGHFTNADTARQQLTSGVYVIKSKSRTIKTTIR